MAERLQADGAGDTALQRQTGQHEQVGKLQSCSQVTHTQTCTFTACLWLCGAHMGLLFARQSRREFDLSLTA